MKIAVLGHGVVGSGVVELINKNSDIISKKAGTKVEIKYILDIRDFDDLPYAKLFTKDFNVILNDPEIEVAVEVIGGLEPSYSFVKSSLLAGKNVVTSNKELVSVKGDELLKIAKEKNKFFLFEASVGGGIPVIRPLNRCLAANRIESITGILNGTTNFILTKMVKEGYSFEQALKTAQQLGYAEANPAADIEGIDSCRKIAILASLSYGSHVAPDKIHTEGITGIKLEDIRFADALGYAVKLLGTAKKNSDGTIFIMVAPFLVEKSLPLAGIEDVYNGILVEGDAVGTSLFYGRGAGKLPTASAVVADVIDCAARFTNHGDFFWDVSSEDLVADYKKMPCRRFVTVEGGAVNESDISALSDMKQYIVNDGKTAFITSVQDEYGFTNRRAEFESKTHLKITSVLRVYNIENGEK